MKVSWTHDNDSITFTMSAPTNGWVTIGFNDQVETTNSYLLMGNVILEKAVVVEHYTISSGNYKSFDQLNVKSSVEKVNGTQTNKHTSLTFRLPHKAQNKYAKNLNSGNKYVLLVAYSQEDDFQHHSIMRTSLNVIL